MLGETVIDCVVAPLLQEYEVPAAAVSVVDDPLQIVDVPVILEINGTETVTLN